MSCRFSACRRMDPESCDSVGLPDKCGGTPFQQCNNRGNLTGELRYEIIRSLVHLLFNNNNNINIINGCRCECLSHGSPSFLCLLPESGSLIMTRFCRKDPCSRTRARPFPADRDGLSASVCSCRLGRTVNP